MTKNEKYWQARTAQRMWEHMQSAEETADQVVKVYAKASLYLSREMQDIFKKYVEKHHLTEKEAAFEYIEGSHFYRRTASEVAE